MLRSPTAEKKLPTVTFMIDAFVVVSCVCFVLHCAPIVLKHMFEYTITLLHKHTNTYEAHIRDILLRL